jgi:hypothetical protein
MYTWPLMNDLALREAFAEPAISALRLLLLAARKVKRKGKKIPSSGPRLAAVRNP